MVAQGPPGGQWNSGRPLPRRAGENRSISGELRTTCLRRIINSGFFSIDFDRFDDLMAALIDSGRFQEIQGPNGQIEFSKAAFRYAECLPPGVSAIERVFAARMYTFCELAQKYRAELA